MCGESLVEVLHGPRFSFAMVLHYLRVAVAAEIRDARCGQSSLTIMSYSHFSVSNVLIDSVLRHKSDYCLYCTNRQLPTADRDRLSILNCIFWRDNSIFDSKLKDQLLETRINTIIVSHLVQSTGSSDTRDTFS